MRTHRLPGWAQPGEVVDLLRLALPIALSRASIMLMSLTDVVVLSHNADLEVPFMTNGWLVVGVGLAVGMGILQGVQVFTAELSGEGFRSDTGRVFRRGLWVGSLIGLLFTLPIFIFASGLYAALGFDERVADSTASVARILALGLVAHMISVGCSYYLEALRRPTIVALVMYGGVIINLVLNLFLVAGWFGFPKLGADGVAWATTGTRIFLALALVGIIFWSTPGFRPSKPAPKAEFWRQNTVGAGGALANVAEFGGFNFTFIIATWASLLDGTAYALALQTVFLTFMLYMGLGTATSVRIAEAYGRRDSKGVRDAARLGMVAGLLMGLVMIGVIYFGREAIALGLAGMEEGASDLTALKPMVVSLLVVAAVAAPFDGMQGFAGMALRAQEIVWPSAMIQIGSYFLVMLPLAYHLAITQGEGAVGVMVAVLVTSVLAASLQLGWLEWKGGRVAPRSQH